MLKYFYVFFLGLFIALFVGTGISVFYTAPKSPDAPQAVMYPSKEPTAEEKQAQADFDAAQKQFQAVFSVYNRNVSIITIIFAVLLLIISFALFKIDIVTDGLLLGGVFTLLYSIIRGLMANDNIYRFIVVSVGLLVTIVLGYFKFKKQLKA